jgi:hypothetical protein
MTRLLTTGPATEKDSVFGISGAWRRPFDAPKIISALRAFQGPDAHAILGSTQRSDDAKIRFVVIREIDYPQGIAHSHRIAQGNGRAATAHDERESIFGEATRLEMLKIKTKHSKRNACLEPFAASRFNVLQSQGQHSLAVSVIAHVVSAWDTLY